MRSKASLLTLVAMLALSAACSWSRFDDYKSNTPMFALGNKAFGARVAIAVDPIKKSGILLAGGVPGEGARYYALGDGSVEPNTDPNPSEAVCEVSDTNIVGGRACISSKTIGAVGAWNGHVACFAVGYGKWAVTPDFGPVIFCTDNTVLNLKSPGDLAPKVKAAFAGLNAADLRSLHLSFAILPGAESRPLLFGDESDETAFVYLTLGGFDTPAQLTPSPKGARFGAAVAVGKLKTGESWYAVSAPGKSAVYVFRGKDTGPFVHVGCAQDPSGSKSFGDSLAAGDLNGDGNDELLVGGASTVAIFDGNFPAAAVAECGTALPAFATPQLSCAGANGCVDSARFGASIAVGDLNADGNADVAVGAPGAAPDGVSGAGAVYLFTPKVGGAVLDVRYVGNVEADAQFGAGVAIAPLGGQDTLAVGAQGKNTSYIAWCTSLEPGIPTARCRK